MLLDVAIGKESLSLDIGDPYRLDLDALLAQVESFASARRASLDGIDLRGLIPKMVRGIAGCEGGCPANARSLVERGFRNFRLRYIEGGILAAQVETRNGETLSLKMFPEF